MDAPPEDKLAVYAWMGTDSSGEYGILAIPGPDGGFTPLATKDRKLATTTLARFAEVLARVRGTEVHLHRFDWAEQVASIKSSKGAADAGAV